MPARWLWLCLAATLTATTSACVPESDDACGPAMRYEAALYACVCTDDAVEVAGGCQRCAADEVPAAGVCACPPGEAKNPSGVCATVPGLGDPCDETRPCTDAVYDTCAGPDGATACTRTCTADADCTDTYVCADWEPAPYCRTYTGVGASCTSHADCATYDADFCGQGRCVVNDCTVGIDECPRGQSCCDLSAFGAGTICLPPGACP